MTATVRKRLEKEMTKRWTQIGIVAGVQHQIFNDVSSIKICAKPKQRRAVCPPLTGVTLELDEGSRYTSTGQFPVPVLVRVKAGLEFSLLADVHRAMPIGSEGRSKTWRDHWARGKGTVGDISLLLQCIAHPSDHPQVPTMQYDEPLRSEPTDLSRGRSGRDRRGPSS